ncbi:hypothetical protein AB6A40_010974 [Gnathostoma spinigerum]|uniref:Uncharacterized protein n=1 Tax=Gnathostoma spinigerum TaxID=75299 RepID=A0ABD6EXT5_9BILA
MLRRKKRINSKGSLNNIQSRNPMSEFEPTKVPNSENQTSKSQVASEILAPYSNGLDDKNYFANRFYKNSGNATDFGSPNNFGDSDPSGKAEKPVINHNTSTLSFFDKLRNRSVDRGRSHSRSKSKSPDRTAVSTANVPVRSTDPLMKKSTKDGRKPNSFWKPRSFSADSLLDSDSMILTETLEALGEDQPIVARSIPKHAPIVTSDFAEKSLKNCLFDASVYENMLGDSLKVGSFFSRQCNCDRLSSSISNMTLF